MTTISYAEFEKVDLRSDLIVKARGETTQVPVVFSVKLHSHFRGMISAEGREVIFEGGVNAR